MNAWDQMHRRHFCGYKWNCRFKWQANRMRSMPLVHLIETFPNILTKWFQKSKVFPIAKACTYNRFVLVAFKISKQSSEEPWNMAWVNCLLLHKFQYHIKWEISFGLSTDEPFFNCILWSSVLSSFKAFSNWSHFMHIIRQQVTTVTLMFHKSMMQYNFHGYLIRLYWSFLDGIPFHINS